MSLQKTINQVYETDIFATEIIAALRAIIRYLKEITLSLCKEKDN